MKELLESIGLKQVRKEDKHVPFVTISITGDCNDADYITEESLFELEGENAEEDIDALKKIVKIIKNYSSAILKRDVANKYLNEDCSKSNDLYCFFHSDYLIFLLCMV